MIMLENMMKEIEVGFGFMGWQILVEIDSEIGWYWPVGKKAHMWLSLSWNAEKHIPKKQRLRI